MKSYFLEGIRDQKKAKAILSDLFPQQSQPWIMETPEGDVAAYLHLLETSSELNCPAIQCDISGRHYGCDEHVLDHLHQLQKAVGGIVSGGD